MPACSYIKKDGAPIKNKIRLCPRSCVYLCMQSPAAVSRPGKKVAAAGTSSAAGTSASMLVCYL